MTTNAETMIRLFGASWPWLLLLAALLLAGLAAVLWPEPLRFPPPQADQTRPAQEFPSSSTTDLLGSTAVEAFSTWGLPLGEDGELVPYEVPLDNGPIFWNGSGEAHIQQIRVGSEKRVLKIMLEPNDDDGLLAQAYQTVETLRVQSPEIASYLCPARFLPRAVSVMDRDGRQRWTDVILMPYQREMLSKFIRGSLQTDHPEIRLRKLAKNFRRMVATFHRVGVLFGDYHAGNIVVGEDCRPLLIDLDNLSRVEDPDAAIATRGHDGFQPPGRLHEPEVFESCAERVDFFSEWVVYTSLMAYAYMDDAFDLPDKDHLLFTLDDLQPGRVSHPQKPLHILRTSGHPLLEKMAEHIAVACTPDLAPWRLFPLEELFTEKQFTEWEADAAPVRRRI